MGEICNVRNKFLRYYKTISNRYPSISIKAKTQTFLSYEDFANNLSLNIFSRDFNSFKFICKSSAHNRGRRIDGYFGFTK